MVEVPEFTMIPPVNESWVEVALFGKGQVKPSVLKSVPQEKTPLLQRSLPVVELHAKSPSAKRSEVEAVPEIVIAVEDAYGRMLAVAEVALKRSARSTPSKDPPPATEKSAAGVEVPTPTYPVFMMVKSEVVAKAAVDEEMEKSVVGASAWPEVVVEFAAMEKSAKGDVVPMPTLEANVLFAVVEVETM
jgi:hypothetical protein